MRGRGGAVLSRGLSGPRDGQRRQVKLDAWKSVSSFLVLVAFPANGTGISGYLLGSFQGLKGGHGSVGDYGGDGKGLLFGGLGADVSGGQAQLDTWKTVRAAFLASLSVRSLQTARVAAARAPPAALAAARAPRATTAAARASSRAATAASAATTATA